MIKIAVCVALFLSSITTVLYSKPKPTPTKSQLIKSYYYQPIQNHSS
jgi:hypothetical protein